MGDSKNKNFIFIADDDDYEYCPNCTLLEQELKEKNEKLKKRDKLIVKFQKQILNLNAQIKELKGYVSRGCLRI